jgi:hypothetical protein
MFGKNNEYAKHNEIFKTLFPRIFEFIKEYKKNNGSHKELSCKLQSMESQFIFNYIVKHIIDHNPEIKLFTVHDSIITQYKYKKIMKSIFDYYRRNIFELKF